MRVQEIDAGLVTLLPTLRVSVVLVLLLLLSGQLAPLSLGALALWGLAAGVSSYCYHRALQLGPMAMNAC